MNKVMSKEKGQKGVVLLLVLGTLLVVIILANVVLSIVSSQSRLTHHQVSRIQAYYASQAAVNYALEKLRLGSDGNWKVLTASSPYSDNYTRYMCKENTGNCAATAGSIIEPALPTAINYVEIKVIKPQCTSAITAECPYKNDKDQINIRAKTYYN